MKAWLAKLKYYLCRKYLTEELIRDGWRQDPTDAKRLIKEELAPKGWTTLNMADHDAISYHFKRYPLRWTPDKK